MPGFGFDSQLLRSGFVFYQRLADDGQEELLRNVQNRLYSIEPIHNSSVGNILIQQSKIEAEKDLKLLEKKFGTSLSFTTDDVSDPAFFKKLTEAINRALQGDKIFERAVKRLQSGQAYGSVAQFFPDYFQKYWEKERVSIHEEALKKSNHGSISYIAAVKDELEKRLPIMIENTLIEMLNSKDLNKKDETNRSLQSLLNYLNSYQGDELTRELYKIYHMDELKQKVEEEIEQNGPGVSAIDYYKKQTKNKKTTTTGMLGRMRYFQDGGLALEAFENFVINSIADELQGASGTNFKIMKSIHSGEKGIKPDNIIAIDIDPQKIIDILDSHKEKTSREENAKLATKIWEEIRKLKDGFIIYSSDKNYGMAKLSESSGLKGDYQIKLGNLMPIIKRIPGFTATFRGAIANLIPGAAGEGMNQIITDYLASNMAYFLFDDVAQIGMSHDNTTNAIHLFMLSGVYVPLSYLLFSLGQAINSVENNSKKIKSISNVSIKTPSGIQFPEPKDTPTGEYTYDDWVTQKNIALEEIIISMHFAKNINDFITSLNIKA